MMKWLKDFLERPHSKYNREEEQRINYYAGLEEMLETALERANNAENRASEAEQRMKVMTTLRNKDLVADRATHIAKSVNNLYVWSWKSPEERTRAIEILIEQLLIAQIEGNADWTDYNTSDKGQ